jgi:hypothetical protein
MRRSDLPIHYDPHALRRMSQRSVSREQIEQVVRSPDAVRPAKRRGALRLEKAMSARKRLAVIAEVSRTDALIVSAWWM